VKKSQLVNIIREELKAVLELTAAEKAANVKAAQADIEAKKIALKGAQDKLTKTSAAPVDQK
jgi:hypothetical protein